MRFRSTVGWALAFLLALGPVGAADIYVDGTSGDDTNSGSSANPLATIAEAVARANPTGDRILVEPGTYAECIDTAGKTIELISTEWIDSTTNAGTVLDGLRENGCGALGPVVYLGDGSTLNGFTVRGGLDTGVVGFGGAVITNNAITGNEGSVGGGLYVADTATILNNRITQNVATQYGGGMFLYATNFLPGFESEMLVEGNHIEDNEALLDGGGAYVYAVAVYDEGPPVNNVGPPVNVRENVIENNTAEGFGGGLAVFTFAEDAASTSVAVTSNTIDGNSLTGSNAGGVIGFGGGAWATTYGLGSESIVIDDNTVNANAATASGGGLSTWIQTFDIDLSPDHEIRIRSNDITSNTSDGDGGGLDVYVDGRSLQAGTASMRLHSEDNRIDGNRANGSFGFGGGVFALVRAERTGAAGEIDVDFERDEITSNHTTVGGGGAALFTQAFADPEPADPNNPPEPLPTVASLRMANALVAGNTVADPVDGVGSGGGIFTYVDLDGSDAASGGPLANDGLSSIELDVLTVTDNTSDIGGAIEIEALRTNTQSGVVAVAVHNSIVSQNDGYGIGGPAALDPGNVTASQSDQVEVEVTYDDLFANASGDIEANITPTSTTGTIFVDPLLDANAIPGACSPTIDGGDPSDDVGNEPAFNGDRINMGHLGGTSLAVRTLSDITGDAIVDGFDVIQITTRFAASAGVPGSPYIPDADFDGDGMIDGDDLSLVAADFGLECTP